MWSCWSGGGGNFHCLGGGGLVSFPRDWAGLIFLDQSRTEMRSPSTPHAGKKMILKSLGQWRKNTIKAYSVNTNTTFFLLVKILVTENARCVRLMIEINIESSWTCIILYIFFLQAKNAFIHWAVVWKQCRTTKLAHKNLHQCLCPSKRDRSIV